MRYSQWKISTALVLGLLACDGGTGPERPEVLSVSIVPAADTLYALQDTARLSVEVRDAGGAVVPDAEVSWSSLERSVATVDSLGRVVARGVGAAQIVARSGDAADTALISVISGAATEQLDFVQLASTAPPLVTRDTSFWAKAGESRRLEIDFQPQAGESEGEEFLEFRVDGSSLLRRPDGRSFAPGDSVRIRVRVDDAGRFLFAFEPSGLRFNPEEPAELRVRYRHAEAEHEAQEELIHLWRQEQPDAPWVRIAVVRLHDEDEIRAEITGFTAFSLAIPF